MIVTELAQMQQIIPEAGLLSLSSRSTSIVSSFSSVPVNDPAFGPLLEASSVQLGKLLWAAKRALAAVAPASPVSQRTFKLRDRAVILLAARITHARRIPREPELIRRTLMFGTGLQLRAIGRLAIVAIELPFARESTL